MFPLKHYQLLAAWAWQSLTCLCLSYRRKGLWPLPPDPYGLLPHIFMFLAPSFLALAFTLYSCNSWWFHDALSRFFPKFWLLNSLISSPTHVLSSTLPELSILWTYPRPVFNNCTLSIILFSRILLSNCLLSSLWYPCSSYWASTLILLPSQRPSPSWCSLLSLLCLDSVAHHNDHSLAHAFTSLILSSWHSSNWGNPTLLEPGCWTSLGEKYSHLDFFPFRSIANRPFVYLAILL